MKLPNDISLNSSIAAAMRQADVIRECDKYSSMMIEVNKIDAIGKSIDVSDYMIPAIDKLNLIPDFGLPFSVIEENKRMEEIKKSIGISVSMETAIGKMNLVPDFGLTSPVVEEMKRMTEMQKTFAAPIGITGMLQEEMAHLEGRQDFLYAEHRNAPVDIPVMRPLHFERTDRKQQEMVGHLQELVSQGKGTSKQNSKMVRLSIVSTILTIVGILIAVLSYQAGKSSSSPAPPSAPAVKAAPAPVVQPITALAPVPVTPKK